MNSKAFIRIKNEYDGFYRSLMQRGRLPMWSTEKGFWNASVADEIYNSFKKIKLGRFKNFLDIGSGDGKVVLIAALFCRNAEGVEIDDLLHHKALEIQQKIGAGNAVFHNKDFFEHNFSKYDALFLVDAVSSLGGVPIYPQQWGLDYLIASPQKCLGVPPGLGIAIVSERAIQKAERIKNRGYTTDVLEYVNASSRNQTLTTPAEAQVEALDLQLKYIMDEEGLENRFDRHRELAKFAREWAKQKGFELFPDKRCASDTVSCFSNKPNINLENLQKRLYERGYGFDPGYRTLNEVLHKQNRCKTFRIAHMGDRTVHQLNCYLEIISELILV